MCLGHGFKESDSKGILKKKEEKNSTQRATLLSLCQVDLAKSHGTHPSQTKLHPKPITFKDRNNSKNNLKREKKSSMNLEW